MALFINLLSLFVTFGWQPAPLPLSSSHFISNATVISALLAHLFFFPITSFILFHPLALLILGSGSPLSLSATTSRKLKPVVV